jgi:L-asparagine oxygenase
LYQRHELAFKPTHTPQQVELAKPRSRFVEEYFASPEEADRVLQEFVRFIRRPIDTEDLLGEIKQAARSALPKRVVSLLLSMIEGEGTVSLIRGLADEDDLPPTPIRGESTPGGELSFLSEAVVLGVAMVLGEPLGYRAEKNGVLVQNVFPVESHRDSPSNESSSSMLDLHTELVFSRRNPRLPLDAESPDFILLWCLRGDPDGTAETLVLTVDDLCAELHPSCLDVLSQARFELRAPYSFTRDQPGDRPWVGPAPLFRSEGPKRLAAFDLACGTRGIDEAAEEALNELRKAAKAPGIIKRIHLQAGDLLVLDNRRCIHGRTPFSAGFDGRDRWMLRVYIRRSLAGMEPVDPAFPRIF